MEDYKSKYKHALRVVEKLHRSWKETQNRAASEIEEAFPELCESEDERIRKELIRIVDIWTNSAPVVNGIPRENLLSWLYTYSRHNVPSKAKYKQKIEQKPDFCHHEVDLSNCSEEYRKAYYDGWNNCNQQHTQLEAEQKPIWNEEDEKILNTLTKITREFSKEKNHHWFFDEVNSNDINNWLKSIKDRVQPRPKQEWSEEDERNLKEVITHVREYQRIVNPANETGESDLTDWLKFIKYRVQPKQKWRKEDEKMLANVVATLERNGIYGTLAEQINWVKHLKPRWKPNEKQMECLDKAIPLCIGEVGRDAVLPLESLYEDLKNL